MELILTFVIMSIAIAVLLIGLSIFLQGYLYSEPANQMALRALIGSLILAIYCTGWAYINTRAETKNAYGTIFEFNPTRMQSINEFDAIQKYPRPAANQQQGSEEKRVHFRKVPGANSSIQFVDDRGQPFILNTSTYLTIALEIPMGDGNNSERFAAVMKNEWTYDKGNKRFIAEDGNRYIDSDNPGAIYAPSILVVILAIAMNVCVFVTWFIVFWPVLQFNTGHALSLSGVFGTLTVLVLMPLLFRLNAVEPVAVAAEPPAGNVQPSTP